ncbi:MAG: RNA pyrophosphohydrolase [Alphaproteobacteria bacterium]|nr:RNA pyrophosphohydrolase [Alphaproteobacteria bacterium]
MTENTPAINYDAPDYAPPNYGSDHPAQKLAWRACVGIVLLNKHGQVFSGHRCKGDFFPPSLDKNAPLWQYPQGGIDAGETPCAAALRELEEETGVKAKDTALIYELPYWLTYDFPAHLIAASFRGGGKGGGKGNYRGQRQKWFAMRLTAPDSAIVLDAYKKPEFDDWQWRTLNECADLVIPFKRHIYTHLAQRLAYLEV